MTNTKDDGNERRHDYNTIKDILGDIRDSIDKIVAWKENVIERLAKIEQSLKGDNNISKLKEEQCSECKGRIGKLEGKVNTIEISNSREYVKSNTFYEVLKYLFIALTGALGSWLIGKFTGVTK